MEGGPALSHRTKYKEDVEDQKQDDDGEDLDKLMNRRLRKLYPMIREKDYEVCLPRRWDRNQSSGYLELSQKGLCVTFRKNAKLREEKDPSAIVRANEPIPASCGFYYFEVTIVNGPRGCMGVGLSRKDGALNRMPGWDHNCYGYHGDDGNFFSSCGQGTQYGPVFGTNDVIGCGLDTILKQVFFTKNGKHLGVAIEGIEVVTDLYPTVGLKIPGESLIVNFGNKPFVYDVVQHRKKLNRTKRRKIEEFEMPPDVESQMNRMVASFLRNTGAIESLKMFEKAANVEKEEDYDLIMKRREIYEMILDGQNGYKIEKKLKDYFPNVLRYRLDVQIYICCLRFIDLAATVKPTPMNVLGTSIDGGMDSAKIRGASPSSSAANFVSNPNKRTRSIEIDMNSPTLGDESPVKKSPVIERRQPSKNGEGSSRKLEEDLMDIDNDIKMTRHSLNVIEEEEIRKIKYLIALSRHIWALCEEQKLFDRKIVEISLAQMCSNRNMCDPHPLSDVQRKFVANKVFSAISAETYMRQYSELRGMFLSWNSFHKELASKDFATASIPIADIVFNESDEWDHKSVTSNPSDDVCMEEEANDS